MANPHRIVTPANLRIAAFLFVPSFLTVASINLISIHLAYGTLVDSGDMSRSSLFLTMQFFVPALIAPFFLRLVDQVAIHRLLAMMDVGNLFLAGMLTLALTAGWHVSLIYILAGLLGLSIIGLRSGRLEIVKLGQNAQERATLNSIAQTSIYLGVASGAALVPLIDILSDSMVVAWASLGFAGSLVLKSLLCPRVNSERREIRQIKLPEMVSTLMRNRDLCLNFLFVIATMGILQSLMQILRIALPVHVLDGGAGLVSLLQMVMIVGFISAAILLMFFRSDHATARSVFCLIGLALVMATLATQWSFPVQIRVGLALLIARCGMDGIGNFG